MLIVIKYLRLFLSLVLFAGVLALTFEIIMRSEVQQVRKYDDANINHMKYGLFNVNTWKEKLTNIVLSEVKEFHLTESNKGLLKEHVEAQLGGLIDKVDEQIRKSNEETTAGWLKQRFIEAFVDVEDIKEGVPTYADQIVEEMTKDETQSQFKQVIRQRIKKYLDQTFKDQDMSEVNSIVERTGTKNKKAAIEYLRVKVAKEKKKLFYLTWILIAVAGGVFFVSGYHSKKLPAIHLFLCVGTLLSLLFAGVTTPMIDMHASISRFGFSLFGHEIEFTNQVVYFQSKSILDVFWILIADPDIQMKAVGVLLITFSIFVPFFKISSSLFYYYDLFGAKKNRFIQFFVLKSGKWSMTDVQVVAILMAYIGFNGMVSSQFETLKAAMPQFVLISTNGTTLQIGFYIFLSYVVLAMCLSLMVEKQS